MTYPNRGQAWDEPIEEEEEHTMCPLSFLDAIKDNRSGRFVLSEMFIRESPDFAKEILDSVLIYKAEYDFAGHFVEYTGYSHHFEKRSDKQAQVSTPWYFAKYNYLPKFVFGFERYKDTK